MNRKQKIRMLQAIKDGKIDIQSLQPPQLYIFFERDNDPYTYEMRGKIYTEEEYEEFCTNMQKKNASIAAFNEGEPYDRIIKVIYERSGLPPATSEKDVIL